MTIASHAFMRAEPPSGFPIFLFLRNSGRKTASHFSWNCSVRFVPRLPEFGTDHSFLSSHIE
ncbi:hypothetical protein FJ414_27225 [Mesorhizobium sp. B3-1-6]|nr:hypothetical protein FJ414_27225 [Mesorhizobium sp. B3-1-6]TPI58604.1 hypothetical protein FJ417_18415 [Mesorhizobium sp. B3-1-7]TPJ27869.1 hypothetical protein FJ418_27550 [Mesorhizobium sp. B2-8-3]